VKKILAAAAVAAMPFAPAAIADTDVGCGIGSILWEGQTGKVSHILAATTNGSSGNQTFGITFGTLGCDGTDKVTSRMKLAVYTDENLDQLMVDASRGAGESLDVFMELYGVDASQRDAMAAKIQDNFAAIFPNEDVNAEDVLSAVDALMA
jgi:hypothetical protein